MTACRGRIAILRQPNRAEPLRAALSDAGFEVVVRPVTGVEYIAPRKRDEWREWTTAADWVVFTSLNGVKGFAAGAGGEDVLGELLEDRRVAVLGSTSARGLEAMGVRVDVLEERGTSAELVTALLAVMEPQSAVLYPRAERTMPTLPRALCEAGYHLRQVVCYRTTALAFEERAALDWARLDAAFVAAPSAVRALDDEVSLPEDFGFFAIGKTTAAALRQAGLTVLGVAESPTVEGVVDLLVAWFEVQGSKFKVQGSTSKAPRSTGAES